MQGEQYERVEDDPFEVISELGKEEYGNVEQEKRAQV